MKNILVIGGAGYIGSRTVRLLAKQGYNPVGFDNLSKGHPEAVKGYPLEQGDLGDKARLTDVLKKYRIEAVMHFAAFIEVGESVRQPSKYYHNNVAQVLNLLDTLVENNIKYFVFSSTAATFGEPVSPKIDEKHPQHPINPYGKTKLMVEQMLEDFDTAYGVILTPVGQMTAARSASRTRRKRTSFRLFCRRQQANAHPLKFLERITPPKTAPACAIMCT